MTEINVAGSKIEISGVTHEFEHEVEEVVEVAGIVAVLLSIPTGETDNRNVVGFDVHGSFLWKIDRLYSDKEDIPFVYLGVSDDKLIAETWMGLRVTIDPETGKITDKEVVK